MPLRATRICALALCTLAASTALGCAPAPSGETPQPEEATAAALGVRDLWHEDLDLDAPADNLKAFVKARGSLDTEEEVVFYWSGDIYTFVAEPSLPTARTNKKLFRFEGFNVARFVKVADGYQMLSREASFYEDPATGRILDCWTNPLTGADVTVLHVFNDPVNMAWPASTWAPVPRASIGDRVIWSSDVLLAYPSPLPVAAYPRYSASNLYQGAELFSFFTSRFLLESKLVPSAPADIAWTRVGQYLPWMQMGQDPGNLVYHTHGSKLRGGYAALPRHVRDAVAARHPEFAHPPTTWPAGQRNATSWSSFKALDASGRYSASCTP